MTSSALARARRKAAPAPKTWRMTGPSGPMETAAATAAKAWSNLRYRLVHEYGMSWYEASRWNHSDLNVT